MKNRNTSRDAICVTSGDAARFWSFVQRGAACWEWTGGRQRRRSVLWYGMFRLGSEKVGAHRVSWVLANGAIPAGLCVCHRCDNPACVNPSHLWLGTQAENQIDKMQKGRGRHPAGADTYRGREAHHGAKLTAADVHAIRATPYRHGVITELSKRYAVRYQTIWKVYRCETWQHT